MKKFIILSSALLFLFSCSNQDEKGDSLNDNHSLEHGNLYEIETLDNTKWIVVEDMMAHIRNMESEIINFPDTNSHANLGKNLDYHLDLLTSNCTMTGQAHDELHKWLLPFIDLVENLNEAKTKEQQEIAFDELKQSFEVFNQFFE